MKSRITTVKAYFDGQNNSKADMVVSLFSDQGEVFNVNMPTVTGKAGIKAFCENLYDRTEFREFEVLVIANDGDFVFTEWRTHLKFREGAKIGPFELATSFEVELRGVNSFEFEANSELIKCLRVYHETTTVARLASEHAKAK